MPEQQLIDALKAAHERFAAVDTNDKTPRYTYEGKEADRNRLGELPDAPGRRWFTPREIAAVAQREIEEALKAHEAAAHATPEGDVEAMAEDAIQEMRDRGSW